MKVLIVSIIAKLIVVLGVLSFVFALVYTTGNYKFLWFLFLLLAEEVIPIYKWKETTPKSTAYLEDFDEPLEKERPE